MVALRLLIATGLAFKTARMDRSPSLPFRWYFYQENIPEQVKICRGKNAGAFCDYNSINYSETNKQKKTREF